MLTKCKDVRRLVPEKGVNKLFVHVRGVCRIFQGVGRAPYFDIFFRQSYFEANRGTQTAQSKGVRNAPPEVF